ncbi:MAG TPA: hypothetical protein VE967_00530 [Gemmatimonadaceae bacterium]|nr:hypothetical protein [Gemmatimonadaceae bacterium]
MMIKQFATMSVDQWQAQQGNGITAVIANRPYLVTKDAATLEAVYQPVSIVAELAKEPPAAP